MSLLDTGVRETAHSHNVGKPAVHFGFFQERSIACIARLSDGTTKLTGVALKKQRSLIDIQM